MPTIKQLPLATSVSATDVLPVSQGGTTKGLQVGDLLSSTQAAIALASGKLLGRVSSTAGGPEPVSVGTGLALGGGALGATALDHVQLPVSGGLGSADEVVVNSGGAPMRMPAVLLRSLFSAGPGVGIDGSGVVSTAPATSLTLGGVKVGAGLTVGPDGTVATDNSALLAEFVTPATLQTTVQAAIAAAAPSARQYGVKGDGSTDNLAALQAYINAVVAAGGGECVIPAGRYVVSGTLTATLVGNTALVLRGAGADATELVFSGGTDGIVVTYSSMADYRRDVATGAKLRVSNLSVVRAVAGVAQDGIRVVGDSRNAAGVVEPATVVDGVVLRGTSAGGGWANHVVYQDVANTSTSRVTMVAANGSSPVASSGSGLVIRTTGSRYATLHTVDVLNTWGCARGMDVYERIQGVEVVNSNMTGGSYGIYWNSVGRQEQLSVSNCQFSTLAAGVYVYNVQNVQLVNNTFYNQNSYAGAAGTWRAIWLAEVDNSQVLGNGVLGANVGSETGLLIVNDLVSVAANRPTVVCGNTFSNLLGQVFHAGNNTTNVLLSGNNADGITGTAVVIESGASASFAGNQFAGATYISGYPGSAGALVAGSGTVFAQAPTHPTPAVGDSSTASATTAFVQAAVAPGGVRVTSGASYAMAATDRTVVISKGAGSATAVTLPASPVVWASYAVKDGSGTAATYPITISGGAAIDGASQFVLGTNWASVSLVFNGVQWSIV